MGSSMDGARKEEIHEMVKLDMGTSSCAFHLSHPNLRQSSCGTALILVRISWREWINPRKVWNFLWIHREIPKQLMATKDCFAPEPKF